MTRVISHLKLQKNSYQYVNLHVEWKNVNCTKILEELEMISNESDIEKEIADLDIEKLLHSTHGFLKFVLDFTKERQVVLNSEELNRKIDISAIKPKKS